MGDTCFQLCTEHGDEDVAPARPAAGDAFDGALAWPAFLRHALVATMEIHSLVVSTLVFMFLVV